MRQTDQGVPLVVTEGLEDALNESVKPENKLSHHTDDVMVIRMKTASSF